MGNSTQFVYTLCKGVETVHSRNMHLRLSLSATSIIFLPTYHQKTRLFKIMIMKTIFRILKMFEKLKLLKSSAKEIVRTFLTLCT